MLFLNPTPDFNRLGYEFHSSTWAIPGVISGHKRGTDAQKPTVLSTCKSCHKTSQVSLLPCKHGLPELCPSESIHYFHKVTVGWPQPAILIDK